MIAEKYVWKIDDVNCPENDCGDCPRCNFYNVPRGGMVRYTVHYRSNDSHWLISPQDFFAIEGAIDYCRKIPTESYVSRFDNGEIVYDNAFARGDNSKRLVF